MERKRQRPRAHEVALAIARPTEDAVLAAVAKHWRPRAGVVGCEPHELPSELLADLRGALQRELRELLEELARFRDPNAFGPPRQRMPPPIADELEPEARPESIDLRPAAVPELDEGHWEDDSPELLFSIDDEATEDAPVDPDAETQPGVNPRPEKRDQRPTIRVPKPDAAWHARPTTTRTIPSWPPPAPQQHEVPTVRPPPPPKPAPWPPGHPASTPRRPPPPPRRKP